MALMNIGVNLLIYEDPRTTSPQVRTPDISKQYQDVVVAKQRLEEVVLLPGETATIASVARPLALDNTTQLAISRPLASQDVVRLTHTGTGTAPGFRPKRALAVDATTFVSITRVSPNTLRLTQTAGTAINTAAVQVGDTLKFERSTDAFTSVFSLVNQGVYFRVQAKGSNYIDFLDNGAGALQDPIALGADFDKQVRVFGFGPVQVGDKIDVSGTLNSGNIGEFTVSDLSDNYVEFVNAFAVNETFTNSSNIVIYDSLIGFLAVWSFQPFKLKVNGASPTKCGLLNGQALFMGSVTAHTIEAVNDTEEKITLTLARASVV